MPLVTEKRLYINGVYWYAARSHERDKTPAQQFLAKNLTSRTGAIVPSTYLTCFSSFKAFPFLRIKCHVETNPALRHHKKKDTKKPRKKGQENKWTPNLDLLKLSQKNKNTQSWPSVLVIFGGKIEQRSKYDAQLGFFFAGACAQCWNTSFVDSTWPQACECRIPEAGGGAAR